MTAVHVGSLNVGCVSQPRLSQLKLKEKTVACSCSYVDYTTFLQSSWICNRRVMRRYSQLQPCGYFIYCPRITHRKRSFHAVSFQDLAASDSEGNEPSSADTLDFQQRQRIWQNLQVSIQSWRQSLKDRGSLGIAKEILATTEIRLKNADAKQVIKEKLQTWKPPQPSVLWSSIHPSIKWPVIIFGAFYLGVTITCGKQVSDDLWRVWLIGPLAMSFYIQAGIFAVRSYKKYGAPYVGVLVQRAAQLVQDVHTGKLKQDVRSGVEYSKKYLADARESGLRYLKTRALHDLKKALIRFARWLYERYEDAIDWLWPSWRVFVRVLQNLF